MNTMNIPGFNAEAALATPHNLYRSVAATPTAKMAIASAQSCEGCVQGDFPPGFACPRGTTCQGGGCGDGRSCWRCCAGGVRVLCAGTRTISATCLI
jgi:hypothetical protein